MLLWVHLYIMVFVGHLDYKMSKKKQEKGINPKLEEAINLLMSQVMADPEATIIDKTRIIDRALKLEALKMKDEDSAWGQGFVLDDDEDT